MKHKFDALDERIVAAFQRGDRLSNRAVARELGLSEGAIRQRLKRLTESGAISYGLVVDLSATDYRVSGWVQVETKASRERQIAEYMAALPSCLLICRMSGPQSIRAFLCASDRPGMVELVEVVAQQKGVVRLDFREVVAIPHHRFELILTSEGLTKPSHVDRDSLERRP